MGSVLILNNSLDKICNFLDMEPNGNVNSKPEPNVDAALEEDVDLTNITPMPKHVFLNTLPG